MSKYQYDIVKYTKSHSFLWFRWNGEYFHLRRYIGDKVPSRSYDIMIYDKDGEVFRHSDYITSNIKTYTEALFILENIHNNVKCNGEVIYSTLNQYNDPLEEKFIELESRVEDRENTKILENVLFDYI